MPNPLRTFFSFEPDIWAEAAGVELELQPLERHPDNPVIPRGEEGTPDSHRVSFVDIVPEGGRLRAWYSAMSTGTEWVRHNVAYAESADGLTWEKPSLDAAAPGTNFVLRGANHLNVLIDESGGGPRYRGMCAMFRPDAAQKTGTTFDVVTSEDGIHWDFRSQPRTHIRHFESYGLFRHDGLWWTLGQGVSPWFTFPDGREHGRVMYGFYSEDWETWELYPRPLFAYDVDPFFPKACLQNHVGAGVWNRGRILLGLQGQFWPAGFSSVVRSTFGLITSHDGVTWAESFSRRPLLMPGQEDAWDRGMLLQAQRPVSRGDRTYVYYVGGDSGNVWETKTAVGLATIRRDGFAAYTSVENEGTLVTAPLAIEPQDAFVYVNGAGGVSIQPLDRLFRPLSAETTPAPDGVRGPVVDLRQAHGKGPIRLHFRLERGAKLYTFSLGPAEADLPSLDEWE